MSAFHLLKIPPESSRPEIDNAREDASFDARESEDILQKAVDTLTAPMPRLREEVSYLWGMPLPKIDELIHLAKTDIEGGLVCKAMEKMSLPALTKANLAAHFCGDENVGNANNLVDALQTDIRLQRLFAETCRFSRLASCVDPWPFSDHESHHNPVKSW